MYLVIMNNCISIRDWHPQHFKHNYHHRTDILVPIIIYLSDLKGVRREILKDFIGDYISTASEYQLSYTQRVQLFQILFRVEALRFYNFSV